ncbi:sugar phosphate isomerase/epimerase [soil metagenome]
MKLSVQLYTLRDPLGDDFEGTLSAVKEIGLEYVELAGDLGRSAQEWRETLDRLGLKASGAHIGLALLDEDLDKVIADAKTIGFKYVIVPWVGTEDYNGGWTAFGKRLAPLGEKLAAAGLALCYHNHDFEYKNGDGMTELYASVPPSVLQAEIDAAWVKIGGYDPIATVSALKGRLPLVHLKDFDPDKTPRWVPAGAGVMPMVELIAAAKEAGAEFGVIELDESPGAPLDAVKASFEYLSDKV